MTAAALLVVIALPVAGAVISLVVGHRDDEWSVRVGVVATAGAWIAAVALGVTHWGAQAASTVGSYQLPTGGLPISFVLRVDQLTASMLVLATSVAALVQVYSVAYLRGDPRRPSYTALVSLFTAAMALVVAADDLFVLLVGWEIMGVCSYYLISHHWELAEARAGAVKAFVVTRLGDIGLLFAIFVLGDAAGTYRISGVLEAAHEGAISHGQATTAALLVLCGVVGKSAQFPLHTWLPDAMPGPTPISALIHAATMVAAGVFLVARLLPVFELSPTALTTLAVIAAITMLGAALMALAAEDLKRILAWSTVSQLAYMFGALSLGGYAAGVLHLLAHGAFKALLFLAAGSVIHAVGTQRVDSMGGLRRAMPITFATMTVGFAALAGLPPLVGFFSKDEVLGLAAEHAFDGVDGARPWLILVVGYLTAAVTAAYATRAWLMVFFGPRRRQPYAAEPHESPALMRWPLIVLAIASATGGVAVVFPHFLGVEHTNHWWMFAVSSLVVLVAVAFTAAEWSRLGRRDPVGFLGILRRPAAAEFGLDRLMVRGVAWLTRTGARVVVGNERQVVDAYVRAGDAGAHWSGRILRRLHDGNVQRYVTAVVVGAVAVAVIVGVMQG